MNFSILLVLKDSPGQIFLWDTYQTMIHGHILVICICTIIHIYFGQFLVNYQVVGHVECVERGKVSNWLQLVNLIGMSKKIVENCKISSISNFS